MEVFSVLSGKGVFGQGGAVQFRVQSFVHSIQADEGGRLPAHRELDPEGGRQASWKEARDERDAVEIDDQNWCPMPLATKDTHAGFFTTRHPRNMAVYKSAMQKQLRGCPEEKTPAGIRNCKLPASGGVPLAQLADIVRKHDYFIEEEHVLEAALALCGGTGGTGKPIFVVAYQRTRSTPNVPSREWLLSQGCSIWLLEGCCMEVWPPLAVRRAILEVVQEVPRGWCPEAYQHSYPQRVLDLSRWHATL